MSADRINLVYLMRRMAGGMQKHLLELVSHLDHKKYRITVIAPENPSLKTKLAELSIPLVVLDIDDRLRPFKDRRTVKELRKILESLKPDILHIHGNKSALVGRLAARRLNVPVVIVTVHNFLIYQEANGLLRVPASWMERWLAKYTDCLITVSGSLENSLVEVEGLPREKIITIPNGIDLSDWKEGENADNIRQKLGISENNFLIVNVGRLVSFKGHGVLLRAAKVLIEKKPNVKVVIAGDGPLKDELLAEGEKLNLRDKVLFLGFVSYTKQLLAAADMFVLPSLKEPFGIVILEAMAARVPVVATRAGGVPEIVKGESGVLVAPGDPDELADAIIKLIDDQHRRRELAANAYERVVNEFSIEKMVSRTEGVYQDHLRRKLIA